jgi:hypothetical protein
MRKMLCKPLKFMYSVAERACLSDESKINGFLREKISLIRILQGRLWQKHDQKASICQIDLKRSFALKKRTESWDINLNTRLEL